MKIAQEPIFKPITIVFETEQEASDFIALMDFVDGSQSHANWEPYDITKGQNDVLVKISDYFSMWIGVRDRSNL